jgi:hypothetical protein
MLLGIGVLIMILRRAAVEPSANDSARVIA